MPAAAGADTSFAHLWGMLDLQPCEGLSAQLPSWVQKKRKRGCNMNYCSPSGYRGGSEGLTTEAATEATAVSATVATAAEAASATAKAATATAIGHAVNAGAHGVWLAAIAAACGIVAGVAQLCAQMCIGAWRLVFVAATAFAFTKLAGWAALGWALLLVILRTWAAIGLTERSAIL